MQQDMQYGRSNSQQPHLLLSTMFFTVASILALVSVASASPIASVPSVRNGVARRSTTNTGQYTCLTQGDYTLCDDYWNESCGTGSQSTTLTSTSGNTIAWSTTYNWTGSCQTTYIDVKSYSNVEPTSGEGVLLSSVTSIPTTWDWSYTKMTNVDADVSYDMWLGTTADGAASSSASSYEIMVWLSKEGSIQPIGSSLVSSVSIDGYTWDLWGGSSGDFYTYSFVCSSQATSFSSNLLPFFTYLVANEGVSKSLYLQHIQAGTEAFQGQATLTTTSFSVSIVS